MSYFKYAKLAAFIILKKYHIALVRRGIIWGRDQHSEDVKFSNSITSENIPRNIFIFWAQGIDSAPEIVKICIDSWTMKNSGWNVKVLNLEDVQIYLGDENLPEGIPWAAYSDLLRAKLLRKYGGVWADATLFCERPLDDWLFDYVKTGFFAFYRPHPDRELSSWFLASVKDSEIISKWDDLSSLYWIWTKKFHAYHWFHYTFEYLKRFDSGFSRAWSMVPKITPHKLHLLNRLITNRLKTDDIESVYRLKGEIPMSKVTYKHDASSEIMKKYLNSF
jgi:hypothetical protein